jgi:hypothetical protein
MKSIFRSPSRSRFLPLLAGLMPFWALPVTNVAGTTAPSLPANIPPFVQSDSSYPFGVGEHLEYDAKFGFLQVGHGYMTIAGIDTVRGREAYHVVFELKGRALGVFKVDDRYESWMATDDLSSLRYLQKISEGNYHRTSDYAIYPERQVFTENGNAEETSVSHPLDDGSFLYFVRTLHVSQGNSVSLDRYFKADRNPVTIQAVGQDTVSVPAGTFSATVLKPIIKTSGIFSDKGEAHVWISNDPRHLMIQMKAKLSFGSLNLYLKSYRPPVATTTVER